MTFDLNSVFKDAKEYVRCGKTLGMEQRIGKIIHCKRCFPSSLSNFGDYWKYDCDHSV